MTRGHRDPASSGDGRASVASLNFPFAPPPAVVFPNAVFDALMPACDPYEWKIVCAVLRHQHERKLSVGDFMRWTGLEHRKTCFDALTRCLGKGYIVRVPVGNSFAYHPNADLELPARQQESRL